MKLKVNDYAVLNECVENGIILGWNKAHKHTDKPSELIIKENILRDIMLQISEKFIFNEAK